jgi:hypothetical protein
VSYNFGQQAAQQAAANASREAAAAAQRASQQGMNYATQSQLRHTGRGRGSVLGRLFGFVVFLVVLGVGGWIALHVFQAVQAFPR